MRRGTGATLLAVALVLTASPGARAGQEAPAPAAQGEPESAAALYERLVAEVRAAQQKAVAEYQAAAEEARKEAEESGRPASMPSYDMRAGIRPLVPRFVEAAAAWAGKDDAVPFLEWLVFNARGEDAGRAALDTLLAEHLGSARIGRFVAGLAWLSGDLGAARTGEVLDRLVAQSPSADVRAQALITRAELARGGESDASRQLAVADLERAAETAEDPRLAARARGILNELSNLQIGQVAPDIEGADLDGVAFRLSDYRGKVVVLDFWGDW